MCSDHSLFVGTFDKPKINNEHEILIVKILGAMSLTCLLAMSSCSNDEQPIGRTGLCPRMFPHPFMKISGPASRDAADVSWSVADGYAVATFTLSPRPGAPPAKRPVWYRTERCAEEDACRTIAFGDLPEVVRAAFAGSEYGADAEDATAGMLTRYAAGTVETVYFLQVTTTTDGAETAETTLYYTADGVLAKLTSEVVYDSNYDDMGPNHRDWPPRTLPDYVAEFVSRNYPQAEYLYIYEGRELTKVKILTDGKPACCCSTPKELALYPDATSYRRLPEAALAAFRFSDYADRRIDGAEEYLRPTTSTFTMLTVMIVSASRRSASTRT